MNEAMKRMGTWRTLCGVVVLLASVADAQAPSGGSPGAVQNRSESGDSRLYNDVYCGFDANDLGDDQKPVSPISADGSR